MPTTRRQTAAAATLATLASQSPAASDTDTDTDGAYSMPDLEFMSATEVALARGPQPDESEKGTGWTWEVVFVEFVAREFGKADGRRRKWGWWIRFRLGRGLGRAQVHARAKEIVRALYSPPKSYQDRCSLCQDSVALTGTDYTLKDEDFTVIAWQPSDMHTSDDDYDAAAGPTLMIATCALIKKAQAEKASRRIAFQREEAEFLRAHTRDRIELDAQHNFSIQTERSYSVGD